MVQLEKTMPKPLTINGVYSIALCNRISICNVYMQKLDVIQGKLIGIKWIQIQLQIKIDFVRKNYMKTMWTFVLIEVRENKTLNVNYN